MDIPSMHAEIAKTGKRNPINTKARKLKVLRGALKLLGPNGEHWTKQKYFGKRTRKPKDEGYAVPSTGYVNRNEADTFCLVGALQQSARDLGFEEWGVSRVVSIHDLISSETKYNEVENWNDAPARRFPEIKDALERRIAQLEEKK